MKRTKIKKRFVDYGCGFPVVIQDLPLIYIRGVWTPDIDYNELHEKVVRALVHNQEQLTGNQIRFIRHFFGLTLVEFGKYFDVSHPAVLKWENAGDNAPAMKWSLERDLRLFIMDKLGESSTTLGNLYRNLHSKACKPTNKELILGTLAREHVVHNGTLDINNVLEFPQNTQTASNSGQRDVDPLAPIQIADTSPNAQIN